MDNFTSKSYLYHYTKLDTLLKIIDSKVLLFGALPKMNDITEVSKEYYLDMKGGSTDWEKLNLLEKRINNIGQISFSTDGLLKGFAINSMWGHYAESGEGCCLVLDKVRISRKCNDLGLYCSEVKYDEAVTDISLPLNEDIDGYLMSNMDKLFFHKSIDWKPEQEFRIINLTKDKQVPNGLPILDSLIGVIFHTNCNKSIFNCNLRKRHFNKIRNKGVKIWEYLYSYMWSSVSSGEVLLDESGMDLLNNNQHIYDLQ